MSEFVKRQEELRANLTMQIREVIDGAESEGRGLDQAELTKIDRIEADIDSAQRSIEVASKSEERASEVAQAARGIEVVEEASAGSADIFRAMGRGEIRGHEFRASEKRALVTGANTVPVDFLDRVFNLAKLVGPYLETSEVFQRDSGEDLRIPVMTGFSTAAEYAAGSAIADSNPTFSSILLQPAKQGFLVPVANELLTDASFPLESTIADQAGNEIGRRADAIIHAAVTAVAGSGVTAGTTNAITGDELVDLAYSTDGAVRNLPETGFVVNTSTLAAIRKLKDDNGYILNYVAGGPSTIQGFPVYESPSVASIATGTKPVFFGHLGSIKVATTGLDVAVSPDYAFNQDVTTYRFTYRIAAGVANGVDHVKYLEMA